MDRSAMPRFTSHENYQRMFKMDARTFEWFCEQVGPFVEKMNTNYKKSIPVTKRVAVALFRLATGANYLTVYNLPAQLKTVVKSFKDGANLVFL